MRKNSLVKVLGDGKLAVKVNVTAHKFSGSAGDRSPPPAVPATELPGNSLNDPAPLRGGFVVDPDVSG